MSCAIEILAGVIGMSAKDERLKRGGHDVHE